MINVTVEVKNTSLVCASFSGEMSGPPHFLLQRYIGRPLICEIDATVGGAESSPFHNH